jgi:predicted esterase YcpF (UPF0227 family)
MLIYIHGFNSSPASAKAQLLRAKLEALGRGAEFVAPALPPSPAQAAALLDALALRHRGAALVGSSLGGYYATWLAEKHGMRAVLLNPAVRPYELLAPLVGLQKRFHTGEEYVFTTEHVTELRALEVERITPSRYFLIVTTGDEALTTGVWWSVIAGVPADRDRGRSRIERFRQLPRLGRILRHWSATRVP